MQDVTFPCAMCEFHGESMNDLITHRRMTHTVTASCSCIVRSFAGKGMEGLRSCLDIKAVYVACTCDECDFNISCNVVLRYDMTTHVLNVAYQCIPCYF